MILLTVLEYLRNETDEKKGESLALTSDKVETTREDFPTVQCVQESKGQDGKGFSEDEVEEHASKQPTNQLDGTGKCVDRFKFLGITIK